MTTLFIDGEPKYFSDGPPGAFVPLAEVDALEAQIAAYILSLEGYILSLEGLQAERDGLRAALAEIAKFKPNAAIGRRMVERAQQELEKWTP